MIIRKKFKFEGAHIVRNCSSDRCKKSIHGHSYVVEVFFSGTKLDRGHMIYDFGLTKSTIGAIIDSFDHAYTFWNKDDEEFKGLIKKFSDRYVSLPLSPSAESYALVILYIANKIIEATEMQNQEGNVIVNSVRVHETTSGYAEAFIDDLEWFEYSLEDIIFSENIKNSWKDKLMYDKLIKYHNNKNTNKPFINPIVK